jgi:hypothetical protein
MEIFTVATMALANPDLVTRIKFNAPLATPDSTTFYGGGAKGYIDYPTLDQVRADTSAAFRFAQRAFRANCSCRVEHKTEHNKCRLRASEPD